MLTLQILPRWGEPLEQSLVEYIIVIALEPCCSDPPMHIGVCLPGGPLSWKMVIKWSSSIGIAAVGPDMGQPPSRKWHVPRWEDLSVAGKRGGTVQPQAVNCSFRTTFLPQGCEMIYCIKENFNTFFNLAVKYKSLRRTNKYYHFTLIMIDASWSWQKCINMRTRMTFQC